MEGLSRELARLKDDGNTAYKANDFSGAFALYTEAIAKAVEWGLVDLNGERSGNSVVQARSLLQWLPPPAGVRAGAHAHCTLLA